MKTPLRLFCCVVPLILADCASMAPRADSSITNNQESGVDEGDIVKAAGDYLVILRRGRLFSVKVAAGEPAQRVSQVDARPPGGHHDAWYDEMLVHDDRVVVIGFSYEMRSTELGLFRLDPAGRLSHEATYYLRSNDYYSSRNYASRLVGGTLVFYMPYYGAGPALRTAGDDGPSAWRELLLKTDVQGDSSGGTLHTVVRCELTAPGLPCRAHAFRGPPSRTFYVSPAAVYVWTSEWRDRTSASVVYRMPLDGSPVTSLRARGMPIDQFSFQEADGRLNVLVQSAGAGDAMWEAEASQHGTQLALLRAPLSRFSSEASELGPQHYQPLPRPGAWALQNRFIGRHLVWGAGSAWRSDGKERRVFVTDTHDPAAVREVPLGHEAERIEALGAHALVVGSADGDLVMSTLALSEDSRVVDSLRVKGAAQGETRSHGFFFKADPDGEGGGVLGLPVRTAGRGWWSLFRESAEVRFVRVAPVLKLTALGALAASSSQPDDRCEVSCVDWYGNSRPIFYRERVFALMGYELVEGKLGEGSISEVGRLSYLSTGLLETARK